MATPPTSISTQQTNNNTRHTKSRNTNRHGGRNERRKRNATTSCQKNKKQKEEFQKQQQEQQQLETMQKMQQGKEEHIQWLEGVRKILQQYDKTPDYIRREIFEPPYMPEKLKKYETERTMGLLQQIQHVEQMVDLVWSCAIQKCYRIYRQPRAMPSHLATMRPHHIPRKNYNDKYTCPYCTRNYTTMRMLI